MNLPSLARTAWRHFRLQAGSRLRPDPVLARNRRFRNLHRGDRCFILGSGPSVLTQDLTPLAGEIVITQNHFHAHPEIAVIRPAYHCVVPNFHPAGYEESWARWFQTMRDRLPAETVYFLGRNTRDLHEARQWFAPDRRFYLEPGLNPLFMRSAAVDLTRRIMAVPTVLTQCLTVAVYMGFAEVYLLGCDLDQVCRLQQDRDQVRFYGHSPITDTKAEEEDEKTVNNGERFFNMWLLWKQIRLLREAAARQGTSIVNCTRGGLLDSFERRVYEEVVGSGAGRREEG